MPPTFARVTLMLVVASVGCENKHPRFETLTMRHNGATLTLHCASGRIEVGLRQSGEMYVDSISSRVVVRGASVGNAGFRLEKVATKPVMLWMSDHDRGRVEYIGLQEVDLPLSRECRSYLVDVDYSTPGLPMPISGVPYVRAAMRP